MISVADIELTPPRLSSNPSQHVGSARRSSALAISDTKPGDRRKNGVVKGAKPCAPHAGTAMATIDDVTITSAAGLRRKCAEDYDHVPAGSVSQPIVVYAASISREQRDVRRRLPHAEMRSPEKSPAADENKERHVRTMAPRCKSCCGCDRTGRRQRQSHRCWLSRTAVTACRRSTHRKRPRLR